MKNSIVVGLSLLASASLGASEVQCTGTPGELTTCHIKKAYNMNVSGCNKNIHAGFLCNGVMIRGTTKDLQRKYDAWFPHNYKQGEFPPAGAGGVSFSYLRNDAKFNKLAYGYVNGLIFFPPMHQPSGMKIIHVLCGFPIDAGTDARSKKGCGAVTNISSGQPCDEQTPPVTTAAMWIKHYRENAGDSSHWRQCGFNFMGTNKEKNFNAMIGAMHKLGDKSFSEQNELRLDADDWPASQNPDTLEVTGEINEIPVEAFFYSSQEGLLSAQKDQTDFYHKSKPNRIIPVIKMTLPSVPSGDVLFDYNPGDQKISD